MAADSTGRTKIGAVAEHQHFLGWLAEFFLEHEQLKLAVYEGPILDMVQRGWEVRDHGGEHWFACHEQVDHKGLQTMRIITSATSTRHFTGDAPFALKAKAHALHGATVDEATFNATHRLVIPHEELLETALVQCWPGADRRPNRKA